jgi:hypothetical protein
MAERFDVDVDEGFAPIDGHVPVANHLNVGPDPLLVPFPEDDPAFLECSKKGQNDPRSNPVAGEGLHEGRDHLFPLIQSDNEYFSVTTCYHAVASKSD